MPVTVLISGGTRGLGKTIVEAFCADPNFVVCTFSRSGKWAEGSESVRMPASVHLEQLDVSDRQATHAYIKNIEQTHGSIGVLINNAGVSADGVLALQSEKSIDQMLQINLTGAISLTKACIRTMLPQRWGRIINITSIVGKTGYRGLSVYSLTKAGLDGFTRSLARELGGRGITVNSIAPGFLETEMTHGLSSRQREQIIRRTPLNRLGTPADVTPLIRFLCSNEAAFITGQTIVIDGGLTA